MFSFLHGPFAATAMEIGDLIGDYRVTRLLGCGGMGVVYEAVHSQLGRRAALKLLRPEFATDPEFLQRFFNEARAVNLIEHPSLVQIYHYDRHDDGCAYLVMELLRGETLAARMGSLSMSETDAVRITLQIADALRATHAGGIVHRDLKPENIMLIFDPIAPARERVKILDFGIAKLLPQLGHEAATEPGLLIGTPQYMSPEQCRGAGLVGYASDVYSLGVILFRMLAGEVPFKGQGVGEILSAHQVMPAPPLQERAPVVAPELCRLVQRMLSKLPDERPTMQDVVLALETYGTPRLTTVSATLVSTALPHPQSAPPTSPAGARGLRMLQLRNARWGGITLGVGLLACLGVLCWHARPTWLFGTAPNPTPAVQRVQAPPRKQPFEKTTQAVTPSRPVAIKVKRRLTSAPPGATIVRIEDGQQLGVTPFEAVIESRSGSERWLVRKSGFQPITLEVRNDRDIMRDLSLQKLVAHRPHGGQAPNRSSDIVPVDQIEVPLVF